MEQGLNGTGTVGSAGGAAASASASPRAVTVVRWVTAVLVWGMVILGVLVGHVLAQEHSIFALLAHLLSGSYKLMTAAVVIVAVLVLAHWLIRAQRVALRAGLFWVVVAGLAGLAALYPAIKAIDDLRVFPG